MEEVVGRYYDLISDHVPTFRMDIPFYSSVTGKALDDSNRLGPSYWRQNLESPVLFHSAIRTVLEHLPQASILVEVGPHSALAGPLRQIFKSLGAARPPPVYLPTLVRGQHGTADLLTTLGQMHLLNVPLNFDTATPGKEVLTNLPTYAWHHDARLWDESRVTREWRLRKFPSHELLGSRILEGSDLEPTWRNLLDVDGLPWLQHHKVFDDVVFPAAGYITMVGEAIRQLSGSDAFSLHHSLIKTALVLQDSSITEIMTCLRQVRLTTALHSEWYEFTISTFNGTAWVEHCIGQVGAGRVLSAEPQRIDALPRKVPTSSWYSTMRKIGLNYGEAFQALTDISAEPNCATAAGSFTDGHRSSSTSYQLHPTSIDSCLQLFNVGISDGIARRLERLYVPTAVEDLYICQGAPEMRARIKISRMSKSSVDGDAIVMAGSTVVMEMKGVHFSLLEDQGSDTAEDSVAGARLQWRPDIDVLPASQLMRPLINVRDDIVKLERLTLLCILETRHQLVGSETKLGYLEKFQAWLDMQADQAATGTYPLIEDACDLTRLSHDERLRSIQTACAAVQDSRGAEVGKVVQQVLDNCAAVFSQQVDPIDVLMKDDGLRKIYDFSRELWDCREFFELLGHAKPTLKILEIGAGTGGTSAGVLDCLMTQTGGRMYSEYCYTDISAGFFVAAQERFKAFPNVDYKVLDISKDPMDQGFQPESYDLIVASNVCLSRSL